MAQEPVKTATRNITESSSRDAENAKKTNDAVMKADETQKEKDAELADLQATQKSTAKLVADAGNEPFYRDESNAEDVDTLIRDGYASILGEQTGTEAKARVVLNETGYALASQA